MLGPWEKGFPGGERGFPGLGRVLGALLPVETEGMCLLMTRTPTRTGYPGHQGPQASEDRGRRGGVLVVPAPSRMPGLGGRRSISPSCSLSAGPRHAGEAVARTPVPLGQDERAGALLSARSAHLPLLGGGVCDTHPCFSSHGLQTSLPSTSHFPGCQLCPWFTVVLTQRSKYKQVWAIYYGPKVCSA